MVHQLTKFHVQRVDMVINPPWNLSFLGAKGLTSPEQTATDPSLVEAAVNDIGCMALNLPFSYLGINIGGHMSRIKAWDNVINKVLCRLSKWKMKSLSIDGKLTLLKSVLGSTLIYYMSMFKAPIHVLKKLESICSHFFNGVDPYVRKMTFVKWDNVLASKEKGGLGVSSFYALNRALIFKWIWNFRTQNNSLWSRVIKAIHGDDGKLGSKPSFSSNWAEIIRDIPLLYNKGDGEFSVSSVRSLIDDKILEVFGPKTRWIKYVPIKVNILAWRIKLDYLPTCLNLSRRDLYKNIARWWEVNMTELSSYEEWWNWFSNLCFPSKLKMVFEGVFYITWWLVWNYRNKSIFGPNLQPKARLFDDIVAFSFTWCRSRCKANFS
ncbi:hypothetical protein Tco_1200565 [Tanacetum coccineum]